MELLVVNLPSGAGAETASADDDVLAPSKRCYGHGRGCRAWSGAAHGDGVYDRGISQWAVEQHDRAGEQLKISNAVYMLMKFSFCSFLGNNFRCTSTGLNSSNFILTTMVPVHV